MNELNEFTFVKEVDILIWQCEAKVGLDPTPKLGMIDIFSRLVMSAYFLVEKVFGWSTSFFLAAMVPSGSAVPTAVATFPLYTGDAEPFGMEGYLSAGAKSVLEMKCFDSEAPWTPAGTYVIADPAIFGGLPVAAVEMPSTIGGAAPTFLAPLSPAFKDGGVGIFRQEEWKMEVASLATLAGTPSDIYQALSTIPQGGDA